MVAARRPKVAVLLDENTSGDATRYEASKNYFRAVDAAGGAPYGVPFLPSLVGDVIADFDGLLCTGGRFAYPDDFYLTGERSRFAPSERTAVERTLVEAFLAQDRPVLGVCAGMQMLACLHGARMVPDVTQIGPRIGTHDGRDCRHDVSIVGGSRLAAMVGAARFPVNSLHREAVVALGDRVALAARADDGVIEAIEIPAKRFAIGLQWHQEAFFGSDHPGNGLFEAFVDACGSA